MLKNKFFAGDDNGGTDAGVIAWQILVKHSIKGGTAIGWP